MTCDFTLGDAVGNRPDNEGNHQLGPVYREQTSDTQRNSHTVAGQKGEDGT